MYYIILKIFLLFAEPQSGFRIAFNMFDTDGNERVDKTEFLVVSSNIIAFKNIIFLFDIKLDL